MNKRVRRGFSLVEVMIAMGILALLIALFMPNYNHFTDSAACRNASSMLYTDILAQRQRTLSTCIDTGITINETGDTGTYYLWEQDPKIPGNRIVTRRVDLEKLFGRTILLRFPCG